MRADRAETDTSSGDRAGTQRFDALEHLREFSAMRPGEHFFGYALILLGVFPTWFLVHDPYILIGVVLYILLDGAYLYLLSHTRLPTSPRRYALIMALNIVSSGMLAVTILLMVGSGHMALIFIGLCGLFGLGLYNLTRHNKRSVLLYWDMLLFAATMAVAFVMNLPRIEGMAGRVGLAVALFTAVVYYTFSLIDAVNTRNRLQRSHVEQVQRAKLAAIGRMTAGVAHDFNNILAVMQSNLDMIAELARTRNPRGPEIEAYVDAALRSLGNGAALTQSLLAFSRQAKLRESRFNLNDITQTMIGWVGRVLPSNIMISKDLCPDVLMVRADRGAAENAILNLLLNAADAQPDGGSIQLQSRQVVLKEDEILFDGEPLTPGTYAQISVSDSGAGIAAEDLDHIFEPFFTTKPEGKGSGLGLSMVYGFMKQSGGAVTLKPSREGGATFDLYFPVAALSEADEHAPLPLERTDLTPARLLLAEDNEPLRRILMTLLERSGYQVTAAITGDEALRIVQDGARFDLVLTDIKMPGYLDGFSLAAALRQITPEMPIIFMTGYAEDPDDQAGEPGDVILTKPVRHGELLDVIERKLDQSRSEIETKIELGTP